MARGLGPKATDANLTPLGPRRRFGTKPDAPKAIEPALAAHAEPGEPIEKPVEKPDVAIQAQVNGRELPPKIAAPSLGYPECIGEGSLTVEAPHCKPVDKPVNKPVPSSNGQAKGPGVPPKTATTKLNHLERAGEGTSTPKVKSVNQPAPKRSADEACLENYTTPAKKAKTDSNVSEHDDEGAPSVQLHHDKLVGQPAPTHADSSTVEAMPKGSRSKFTPTDHGRDSTPTDKVPHDKQANRTAPVTTTPSTSADTTKAPISPPKTAAVTPNPTERRSRSALKVKASHDDVVDQLAPASPATASSETTVKAPDSQPKRAATGSETAESVASPVQAATEARDEAIARRSPPAIARASQRNQPSLSNLGLHPDRLKMIEGSSLMAPPPTEARRKRKSPYDFPPDEASPRTRDSASRRPNPSPSNLGLHPDRLKMLEECSLGPKPVITPGNGRTKRATSPPPAQVHRKRDLPSDFPSDGPSPPKRHKSGPTGSDANLVPLGPSKLKSTSTHHGNPGRRGLSPYEPRHGKHYRGYDPVVDDRRRGRFEEPSRRQSDQHHEPFGSRHANHLREYANPAKGNGRRDRLDEPFRRHDDRNLSPYGDRYCKHRRDYKSTIDDRIRYIREEAPRRHRERNRY